MGDPKKRDEILLALAQQHEGSVPELLETIFKFLLRNTNFFTCGAPEACRNVLLEKFKKYEDMALKELKKEEQEKEEAERKRREKITCRQQEERQEQLDDNNRVTELTDEEAEKIKLEMIEKGKAEEKENMEAKGNGEEMGAEEIKKPDEEEENEAYEDKLKPNAQNGWELPNYMSTDKLFIATVCLPNAVVLEKRVVECNRYKKGSIYPRKCEKCFKILKTSCTFYKHKKRCGKIKKTYPRTCEICKRCYATSSSFSNHKSRCGFNKSDSLKAHPPLSHVNPDNNILNDLHTCLYCGVSFPTITFQNHKSSCNGNLPQTYFDCILSECSKSFSCFKFLCKHVLADHGDSCVKNLTFESSSAFQEWLKSEGVATYKFKKMTGSKRRRYGIYHYYTCQFYKPRYCKPLGFRRNRKGTIPNTNCPARIYASEQEGILKAFYFSQHNHEIKVENCRF